MILGIDPGGRRFGVAIADLETRWAHPLEVIDARDRDPVERIGELVKAHNVQLIVVGRPVSMSGLAGPAVDAQSDFVTRLRDSIDVEVREYDERLTTVVAERALRAGGASAAARRAVRDAVAAQVMLQGWLDWHGRKTTGAEAE